MRTYRGVPLPEGCTRAVLREMENKLNSYESWQEEYYTCVQFAELVVDKYGHVRYPYFVAKDNWGMFLTKLRFSISGSGFGNKKLPMWFAKKFGIGKFDATSAYITNRNRLILIKDILKECYND